VAGRPAHVRRVQAGIWSGLRCGLERPLSEAQLTRDRGWAGALLERLLPRRANSQCRPIGDIRGVELTTPKRPLADRIF
jgi:DNA mismatch repair protein MutH